MMNNIMAAFVYRWKNKHWMFQINLHNSTQLWHYFMTSFFLHVMYFSTLFLYSLLYCTASRYLSISSNQLPFSSRAFHGAFYKADNRVCHRILFRKPLSKGSNYCRCDCSYQRKSDSHWNLEYFWSCQRLYRNVAGELDQIWPLTLSLWGRGCICRHFSILSLWRNLHNRNSLGRGRICTVCL
jgi:hypothetical protein